VIQTLLLTLMLTGVPAIAVASDAAAATPYCGISWGSLAKSSPTGANEITNVRSGANGITNVRTGRHACYDRIVIDGAAAGSVRYVPAVLTQGKGDVVPVRGAAKIEIVVRANDYNINTGAATYAPANPRELTNVTGYSTFRQVAWGGSFEGYTTIGLGVRARLPMRIFTLPGPGNTSRLVIDVAHHW
jgi:hypothetical protein